MKRILFLFILALPATTFAGGPRFVEGAKGNTPVSYANPNLVLNFDIGTLGSRSNAQADALVLQAFSLWNNVSTATVTLAQGDDLANDIDHTNFQGLVPSDDPKHSSIRDGLDPIIYDTDGQIIDELLGIGQNNNVVGTATSVFFTGTSSFITGYVLINGKLDISNIILLNAITHELGHMVGLDHSQLNIDNTENGTECRSSLAIYPMMYPFYCNQGTTLHQDDISAISALYAIDTVSSSFGQITGKLVNETDGAVLGANVWVENIVTGHVYSVVSDYLKQKTGFFSVLLPAGTYTLHANAINPLFTGGASVGPYADSSSSVSFSSPINTVNFEGETAGSTEFLSVVLGEATDVNFVRDGSGSFTTENPIFIPKAESSKKSGGGVIISPATLMLLLAIICFFRLGNRKTQYSFI